MTVTPPTTTDTPVDTPPADDEPKTRRRRSSVTVKSPNPTYTGTKAGVAFTNGEAKVDSDNAAALDYFRAAGYTVGGDKAVEREDLPADTNALAIQTFPGTPEEDKGRHDVAVPPPSAGLPEWRAFAKSYNLNDLAKSKSKDEIIEQVRSLELID